MHLYLFDRQTGAPFTRTKELKVTAALPQQGIAPLPSRPTWRARPLRRRRLDALPAGDWKVSVTDRVSDFDEYAAHLKVPINEARRTIDAARIAGAVAALARWSSPPPPRRT